MAKAAALQREGKSQEPGLGSTGVSGEPHHFRHFWRYMNMLAIEIDDFPIKDGGSFHSYIKLPGDSMALGDFHGINGLPRHADY